MQRGPWLGGRGEDTWETQRLRAKRAEIEKNDRDIGGKGIQSAKEKQKGEKEEGNVERGEKEISPVSLLRPQGKRREQIPDRVLPAPLLVLAGNL